MRNLSDNPYLKDQQFRMREYTVNSFLYDELAVETFTNTHGVINAVASVMALYGFNINYAGFEFLNTLVTYYLMRNDYDESKVIDIICKADGTEERFVRDSIAAALRNNSMFVKAAEYTLSVALEFDDGMTVKHAVEILGALYKICYNRSAESDILDDIFKPVINFTKLVDHGKLR